MRDTGRNDAYRIEDDCWHGTPLAEAPGLPTLYGEGAQLVSHPWWRWGSVMFSETRSTVHDGLGRIGDVRLSHFASRATLCHELAHAASNGGKAHGAVWKGLYIDVTTVMYGTHYGARLRKAYTDHGQEIVGGTARTNPPLIDLDAMLGVAVGGWTRHKRGRT